MKKPAKKEEHKVKYNIESDSDDEGFAYVSASNSNLHISMENENNASIDFSQYEAFTPSQTKKEEFVVFENDLQDDE